jgi:hypothetical protein
MLSTIEGEVDQMDADTFARERLGWWSPVAEHKIEYAIDSKGWQACASNELKPDGKTAYGVKFTADGSEVVLCGAVLPPAGPCRVSLIDRRPTGLGIRWLADWLNERYSKACCVVIDGRNGADVLIDRISGVWKAKGSLIRPGVRDVVSSVSLFYTEINEQTLTWYAKQDALDASVRSCVKRPLSGGWAFGGEDPAPAEACALALWGARTSKRDPNKKMRIG